MLVQTTDKELAVFRKYFPGAALSYCLRLWKEGNFHFKITRKRQSKLGDYRFSPDKGHQITVNQDLNPYAFLITYLHEVAHYQVQTTYKRRKAPHGKEWKTAFRNLVLPVMNEGIFPTALLRSLENYMDNPKASSCADPNLTQALRQYNPAHQQQPLLDELPVGAVFGFQGRQFRKVEKRRTRVLCEEVKTRRRYLISAIAEVE